MNGKLFAAVSIIVLICASLVSAYTGGSVNVSGNATNNSSPVPVTNADTDTDTNIDTNNMSELVLNDSSVDNNSPFSFSDQNTSSNTSSNVIHGGNAVAENHTNVTSEAAAEAESEGNRSSGQTNTGNKTDTDTETDTETVLGAMPDLVVTTIDTINETINKESRPDLIIKDIQTPDKVYSNASNTITATIENIGNANTSVFKVAFSLNDTDTALCLKTVNALPVATTTTLSFDWTPVHAGNYTISVIADPENETIELNDSNNIKTINITVFGVYQTDLKVVKFETAATEPFFAGELNLVKVRIKNVGRDAGSFEVSLLVNETETPVDTERIPSPQR